MKVSPISINYTNLNNNNVRRVSPQVSFCGGKTEFINKVNDVGHLAIGAILVTALSPFALLSAIFSNKNDEIERIAAGLQNEYENHLGNLKYFEEKTNEMNKLLEKHSKNEEYALFVKEAMNFLQTKFERNRYEYDRLEPFSGNSEIESKLNWCRFINTIQNSAKAAVSKNLKGIDIDKLNKDIKSAKEIMKKL